MELRQIANPILMIKKNKHKWVCIGNVVSKEGYAYIRDDQNNGVMTYTVKYEHDYASYVHLGMLGAINMPIASKTIALLRGFSDVTPAQVSLCTVMQNCGTIELSEFNAGYVHDKIEHVPIAGHYHLHLRPTEVHKIAKNAGKGREALIAFNICKSIKGFSIASVASWMLWSVNVSNVVFEHVMSYMSRIRHTDVINVNKNLKRVSMSAKQLQHSIGMDLSPMFEMDVLSNRGVGDVDWHGEKQNRVYPRTVPMSYDHVYDTSMRIFSEAIKTGFMHKQEEFESWWKTRWLHVPNGSAHPQSTKLKAARDAHKKTEGFSKKMLLSSMSSMTLDSLLMERPRLEAWPSVKYEWAKQRAIYGTDVESFIICDIAYPNCESAVSPDIMIGPRSEETYVRKTIELNGAGLMPLCFDYEDFNSQHSIDAMKAVLRAYRETFAEEMTIDQIRCAMWTESSLDNMLIHEIKNRENLYKANGTLLSGWRLTTFINSVLNKCYLDASKATEHSLSQLHSGDDVLAFVVSVEDSLEFMARAKAFGIRAQEEKAVTGGISEFLRIDHRGDKTSSQYLSRACATSVHSRIESRAAISPQDMMDSVLSRNQDLLKRGASENVVNGILELMIERTEKVFRLDVGVMGKYVTLHPIEGGINRAADVSGTRLESLPLSESDDTVEGQERRDKIGAAFTPGCVDIAEWINDKIRGSNIREVIFEKAIRASVEASMAVRRKVILKEYNVTNRQLKDLARYKGWETYSKAGLTSIIKGLDISIVKIASVLLHPMVSTWLSKSKDPIHVASVML